VKLLGPRKDIPTICETRIVELKNTVWVQLKDNEWIYMAPSIDSITILCNEQDPTDVVLGGVEKLYINTGCKGYTTTALLQISLTIMGNSTLKGGDLLMQIPLQYDCCE
jgi:hypothetical protein